MAAEIQTKIEKPEEGNSASETVGKTPAAPSTASKATKAKAHGFDKDSPSGVKRRCVSTACIACRKRKSKCDGTTPTCAACLSVYHTECIYDPNSDHRRKGVYHKDIGNLKSGNSTLQTLIQAILEYPEDEVPDLVKQIRSCKSLDDVAESVIARSNAMDEEDEIDEEACQDRSTPSGVPQFEKELSGKMGKLRLDNGSVSIVGGTSNLIFLGTGQVGDDGHHSPDELEQYTADREPFTSWTDVTSDPALVLHLTNMYFTWHYTFFTTLSKPLFWRDFKRGKPSREPRHKTEYCTPLLVNAILALGCHFTSWPAARAIPNDSATAGDHFFAEAKRLILVNDEHENPRLTTVQALALMSVREAGCGREARGWVYSGMSFRMAYDLGLNIGGGTEAVEDSELDARRITIWGCFLFDKCWSNYLGRQPQLPLSSISTPKFDVFPSEDADIWTPHGDSGMVQAHAQPSRTRAVALQISQLCEISSDLLLYFYHPHLLEKPLSKQAELKKLSELQTRLEAWRKSLPREFEPKEGQLPNVLVMHMFFHLLYIHLFRPFLKYQPTSTPLPSHVSPRKYLTQAANAISKLLRLYRRTYGLRQICNIAVYIAHSACTVHLLNLPDRFARRDITHGLNHLEEISESWLCVRRTLGILQQVSKRWGVDLPEPAQRILDRAEARFVPPNSHENSLSPKPTLAPPAPLQPLPPSEMNTNPPSCNRSPETSSDSYFSSIAPPFASLTSSPPPPSLSGAYRLPTHSPPKLSNQSPRLNLNLPPSQRQQQHTLHRTQTTAGITSPTMIFGGMDGLIKDQEWWLQDSNQIFANWNGYEQPDSTNMTGAGFSSNTATGVGGDCMSNGIDHVMGNNTGNGIGHVPGNGMGNGMYNNDAYGYPSVDNGPVYET